MRLASGNFIPGFMVMLLGCHSPANIGDFKVLPQPQHMEIVENGSLEYEDIQHYHAMDGAEPSWFGELLQHIEPVEEPGKAEILFLEKVRQSYP
jgi:hypothetical protein